MTYVDPKQLLACGQPITQYGPVSMPMTKAQVVATLPSPYYAFKIVNTTETVGSFTEERESAIRGMQAAGLNVRAIEDVTPEMVAPYFAEIGADELKFP